MKYEYLTHTADAKFKAYGKTDEERFTNAALAMFGIIVDPKEVACVKEYNFEIEAKTLRGLLYDFLDELLYYHDVEDFVLSKVKIINIENSKVSVTVCGDSYKNYDTHGHVKAVTYNDFEYTDEYVVMVMDL